MELPGIQWHALPVVERHLSRKEEAYIIANRIVGSRALSCGAIILLRLFTETQKWHRHVMPYLVFQME